ncbi:MAG: pitrilysin family protein [Desulfitobacteriaceae bacterium]|nr:pitrilysin family protein [Desulfitobacteriaceae bacterium]MDD4751782.1 pitrilysin family protein [Desulfitobacteriaceae bacterium]
MIYKDTLPNGIRVITEELPFVHSVSMGIWVGTGSRYENKTIHGVSHFLEHMLFKGTEKRNAKQIAESLETVGGQINAFTSKEFTCFYARVLSENFGLAADVLSDMFLHSLFREDETEKEKNVILEEIKMYEDTPDDLVHDVFARTIWQDNSLGQSIIGTAESVQSLTREQLLSYYRDTYTPQNIVIAVAGKIIRDQVIDTIGSFFDGFNGGPNPFNILAPQVSGGTNYVSKDIEQVHLCLGNPGLSNQDTNIYALLILNSVLGGGVSSRLFQKVREEKGLTYSIYSYHSGYTDTGLFGIYAGTSPKSVNSVIAIILEQINDIIRHGVTDEELSRTKQQIKGSILLGLENVSSRMNRLGKSEISFGRIVTPEEVVESVMNVNNDLIIETAQQIFQTDKFSLAVIGPGTLGIDFSSMIKNVVI